MNNTSATFSELDYRYIALGAATQSASLVNDLARRGQVNQEQLKACMDPLFLTNPQSLEQVYPRPMHFSHGLNALQQSLDSKGLLQHQQTIRYLLGMQVLQRKLLRMNQAAGMIRDKVEELRERRKNGDISPLSEEEFKELAELYQNTLSNQTFRIHVSGNPEHLRRQDIARQVRALLLAGIRSAMLWHQLGGRRWHFFLFKNRIKKDITDIRRRLISLQTTDAGSGPDNASD